MDTRLTPANGRVAAAHLKGKVAAERFVQGRAARVTAPVADLCAAPSGARERQLLFGWEVAVFEEQEGHAFVQSARDGYVGYVASAALGAARPATHAVAARASCLYEAPDARAAERAHLSFGAEVAVIGEDGAFLETPEGHVPRRHLRPRDQWLADPVAVARLHLGVPYLWGGNSILGIDCSGLVQAAFAACGHACPGDSDLQMAALGREIAPDLPPGPGDLVFWTGHVAILVQEGLLIHANGHDMATAFEPYDAARARILAETGEDLLMHKRL